MTKALISIGSNVAGKAMIVGDVLKMLSPMITKRTEPYSDPTDDNPTQYLNVLACVETDMSWEELRAYFKELEAMNGRTHGGDEVSLDIDIVIYDGIVMRRKDMVMSYFVYGLKRLKV